MNDARKIVSIVTPFFNEGGNVELFQQSLLQVIAEVPNIFFEIICVDDGSSDDTLARLLILARQDPRFRIIELSRNFGKEAALTAGIDHARGDAVIPMDADLQDPPELIPKMIEAWLKGSEVVLARRIDRSTDPLLKQRSATWFYRIYNHLAQLKLPENVGDFRLMDRMVVDALKSLTEQQRFMKGLFAWVGFRTVTLDYQRQSRTRGTTKFSGWALWNLALEGLTSFSTLPLKIWTYIGLVGALATSAYAIFIILRTLIVGVDVPGYASLLAAILFIGSLQLVSIGVLGEYIGRIYMESKKRPTYIVRRLYGSNDGS